MNHLHNERINLRSSSSKALVQSLLLPIGLFPSGAAC